MIDRAKLIAIRADMEKALAEVAESHGVSIKTGRATFSSSNATMKVEIADIQSGVAVTRELAELRRVYPAYENARVQCNGMYMTVIGYNRRAKKFPFIAKAEDGREYKLHNNTVLNRTLKIA